MKRLIVFISVILVLFSFSGCEKYQSLSISNKKTKEQSINASNSSIKDANEFIKLMENANYKIKEAKLDDKGELSGTLRRVEVKGNPVRIYEYRNSQEMELDAEKISKDGCTIGYGIYEWKAAPHFYKSGNIIVHYLGDDNKIMGTMEKFMGSQFAGAK